MNLLLLILALVVPIKHPRMAMYSQIAGDGTPFIVANGQLDMAVIAYQARWDEVVLDASPLSEYRPDVLAALREENPKIQLYAFVLGHNVWANPNPAMGDTASNFPWKYWTAVHKTGGFLYTRSGAVIPSLTVNLAKRDACDRYTTAEAMADVILKLVLRGGLWDGLFVDVNCPTIGWFNTPGDSIDYVRAGYSTWQAFEQGWTAGRRAFAERIRLGTPPGFVMVGNCGPCGEPDLYSGWMRENFPFQNGGTWASNMIQTAYGAPGYLVDQYVQPQMSWLSSMPVNLDPTSLENQRRLRYGLGSAALGDGVHTFVRGPDPLRWYTPWWFDEYAVTAKGNASISVSNRGWLGTALRLAVQAGDVWRRDFANGVVLVNPTANSVLVHLETPYRRIRGSGVNDGVVADSVLIGPSDARFLQRVPGP